MLEVELVYWSQVLFLCTQEREKKERGEVVRCRICVRVYALRMRLYEETYYCKRKSKKREGYIIDMMKECNTLNAINKQ